MARILIIEDDPNIRENLTDILSVEGYEIETAANAMDGIRTALIGVPDLILCDIRMETEDSGFRILERLRESETTQQIPFIFLTANAERTAQRRGMNLGADDYITKPFGRIELIEAIESRLNRAQTIQITKPQNRYPYIILHSPGITESDTGNRYDLVEYLIIGRSPSCNVRITEDKNVSGIHTTIQRILDSIEGTARITDGAIVKKPSLASFSSYGVWINGIRLGGDEAKNPNRIGLLKGGERVMLSPRTWFEYRLAPTDAKIDATAETSSEIEDSGNDNQS